MTTKRRERELTLNRTSQRKRRERMRLSGRPDTAIVDRALVEALNFVIRATRAAANKSGEVSRGDLMVRAADIVDAARNILSVRGGYDRVETTKAIRYRLEPRDVHLDPSYVPSLVPDPEMQRRRQELAEGAATK